MDWLDAAVVHASARVALVIEYRTRLIADVVTGKLDVREAAAHLPDELEQAEPLDDSDALAEGDESEDDADSGRRVEEVVA